MHSSYTTVIQKHKTMDSDNYQSLADPHLNDYFNNRRIRRHLIKAGLINRRGDILPSPAYELALATKIKHRQDKEKLSDAVAKYVLDEERRRQAFIRNQFDFAIKRTRVQKIREAQQHQSRLILNNISQAVRSSPIRQARTPSPTSRKRSQIRAKSVAYPAINLKPQLIRRTSKKKRATKDDACEVTMIYYGSDTIVDSRANWYQPNGDEIIVMQQHCGGENLIVFKGFVKPNQIFSFESRRHRDYPFAVAIYINGLINLRISVCCEYKHKPHIRLGSKIGLFAIYNVKNSTPCPSCRLERRMKEILVEPSKPVSPSNYHKSFVSHTESTAEHYSKKSIRAPSPSLDSTDSSTNEKSDHASASSRPDIIPRRSSTASLQSKRNLDDEPKLSLFPMSNSQSPINLKKCKPKIGDQQSIYSKDDSKKLSSSSRTSVAEPLVNAPKSETPRQLFTHDDSRRSSQSEKSSGRFKPPLLMDEIQQKAPTPLKKSNSRSASSDTNEESYPSLAKFSEDEKNYKSTSKSSLNESTADTLPRDSSIPKQQLSPGHNFDPSSSSSNSDIFDDDDDDKLKNNHSYSSKNSSLLDFYKQSNNKPDIIDEGKNRSRLSSRSSASISSSKRNQLSENNNFPSSKNDSETKMVELPKFSDSPTKELDESSSSTLQKSSHHSSKDELNHSRSSKSPAEISQKLEAAEQDLETERNANDSSRVSTPKPAPAHQPRNQNKYPLEATDDTNIVRQYRPMENVAIVWLDATADNDDDDTRSTKVQLRQVARTILTFIDAEKCLQWIQEIKHEKVFLIVSGELGKTFIEQVNSYDQVALIYIYCQQMSSYEYLIDEYKKLKGVYRDVDKICELFKIDSKQWDNDLNTFQLVSFNDMQQLNSEQLSFIQNQLFKEYLTQIVYDETTIDDFVDYCSNLYAENKSETDLLNAFKTNYALDNALNWYAKDCCIYHLLNRAIRMKDVAILFQMGFLIRDINKQLESNYPEKKPRFKFNLFRGQGIKMNHFEELKQKQDGLISFNGFLSTSTKQEVAYEFAKRSLSYGFPVAVLFHIEIDPTNNSYPFSSLEDIAANRSEHEILFSFKAIFHIESIEEIENNIWRVNLTTINQNQHFVSNSIEIESKKFDDYMDYEKLAQLLIQMNELHKAKDIYEMNIPLNSDPKYMHVYNQLGSICSSLKEYKYAILYYKNALRTKSTENLKDYVTISNIHNELGKNLLEIDKYDEALEYFKKALNIQSENLPPVHPSLINTYDLLGMFYQKNEDFEAALEYHNKKLDVQEKNLPSTQSDIAVTHFNIGLCLENLNQYSEALDHVQKSIDMTIFNNFELNNRQAALKRIREEIE